MTPPSPKKAVFPWQALLETSGGKALTPHQTFSAPLCLSTDTRTIGPGCFFLPLSGERFDGHDYLAQAFAQGAEGAFVDEEKFRQHPEWAAFPNLIGVENPLIAYLAMARSHRRRINPKVIAVTGSSGKTTTKDMLFTALSGILPTQKTEKNHNNEVGLSQTLLALQEGTEALVTEMGMRGLHQIDLLSRYAEPDIGIVINVGPAHIGLLGSMENIALAKCEIFDGMNLNTGIGLVNRDDTLVFETARKVWKGRLESYGLSEVSSIETGIEEGIAFHYEGDRIQLALPGRHNIYNALVTLKVGELMGLSRKAVIAGLEAYQPEAGRWNKTPLSGYANSWVINDAYNANPASMRASLEAFLQCPHPGLRRVLVLGAMNELGDFSREYHQQLGSWLAQQHDIDLVFAVGEEARWVAESAQNAAFPIRHAADAEEVADLLKKSVNLEDTLLFLKGSRTFQLEKIPEALMPQVASERHGA